MNLAKTLRVGLLSAVAAAIASTAFAGPVFKEFGPNLVTNGSFENTSAIAGSGWACLAALGGVGADRNKSPPTDRPIAARANRTGQRGAKIAPEARSDRSDGGGESVMTIDLFRTRSFGSRGGWKAVGKKLSPRLEATY